MIAQTAAPASALRAHEELFAYWASRRKGSALPGRRDIDPAGFKRHLPTISLIDFRQDVFRVRLAGTGLYGVYGREITGLTLDQIYPGPEAAEWRSRLMRVVTGAKPVVGVHSLAWRGASRLSLVWLRLPLASDGGKVDMILGYDAVIGVRDEPPSGVRAA
ncbi:MAG: PAS domain-containing protein [Proteobacteria bacterium]|nr:PAS domain-containing protein [Pseudomonadota bacterium]